jgi:RNA recognition motif-containing protein
MYTIAVSNLPSKVTEIDLLNHFGKIVGRKDAVTNISLAYNNEDEIEICRQRGDIIREKIRIVHVSIGLLIYFSLL